MDASPRAAASSADDADSASGAAGVVRWLDRQAREPLWSQLHADLVTRIDAGEFDVAFPGEHALAEAYRVSRQTVRLAVRALREAGVVQAGRGRPPQVTHAISQPMGTLYSLFASVEAAGMEQRSVVLTLDERTDPAAAARLTLAVDDPLVYLERLRLADGEPLALDRVWLPAALTRPMLNIDFTHTALYAEMSQRLSLAPGGGQEEIEAVNLTGAQAGVLGVRAGAAAFALSRLACHRGRPVEWRHTLVRGDRFRLLSAFSPGSGYTLHLGPNATTRANPRAPAPTGPVSGPVAASSEQS